MDSTKGGRSAKLPGMELSRPQAAALGRIRDQLASLGPCLPGSVVLRTGRCGKQACSCRDDPPRLHGPYRSWTRKVGGKTVTRLLSEDQLADYQGFFDDTRKLRALLRDLEALGVAIVDRDARGKRRR